LQKLNITETHTIIVNEMENVLRNVTLNYALVKRL
jgi:hypothetical protein